MRKDNSKCCKEENKGQCCCTCKSRMREMSHPLTDGLPVNLQRGWVCVCEGLDCVFARWPAHGLCELWQKKN